MLRGQDFKELKLSNLDNVHVAPTIADVLGIEPPLDARGKKLK